jgi:hypothetical protein
MASSELMAANDWLKIEELVKHAVSLQSVSG